MPGDFDSQLLTSPPGSSDAEPSGEATAEHDPARPYVVIARRYRPQTFEDLIGQEHVGRAMAGAIQTSRVGHAYLFTGARGVGKTSAARILGKALNCVHGPTPTPCNECDICRSVSSGDDVDVLEIDGASNRGVDEIRQLRQNVAVRPSRARFKIYIIDEVHMLTREAFNALLKTLEEPPEHVKFIFCTTEPEKVPITIQSRCQRFDFAGIQTPAIARRLEQICRTEGVEPDAEALEILARSAAGSMRDSQSLLEQVLSCCGQRLTAADVHSLLGTAGGRRIDQLVAHLVDRNAAGALAELDAALAEGVDVGQLLDQLLGYFRDGMAAAVGCGADALLNTTSSQYPQVADAARRLGLETILAVIQILDQTLARFRQSTHVRTLAEMALVRICKLEDLDALSSLVAELRSGGIVPAMSRSNAEGGDAKKKMTADSHMAPAVAPTTSRTSESPVSQRGPDGASANDRESSTPAGGNMDLTAENAAAVWQRALSNLSDLVSDQASMCERVAIRAPNRLVVRFAAKYNACKAYCERPDQIAKLERSLADVTGQTVRIELEVADPVPLPALSLASSLELAPPPKAVSMPPKAVSMRQRIAEKSQHPLVRRATELFDATVMRVDEPG
jgi:DNA polymerase-3 subunit gamma/tau